MILAIVVQSFTTRAYLYLLYRNIQLPVSSSRFPNIHCLMVLSNNFQNTPHLIKKYHKGRALRLGPKNGIEIETKN